MGIPNPCINPPIFDNAKMTPKLYKMYLSTFMLFGFDINN